jgi:hypothetical protein
MSTCASDRSLEVVDEDLLEPPNHESGVGSKAIGK